MWAVGSVRFRPKADIGEYRYPSDWVVLTRDKDALGTIATDARWRTLKPRPAIGLWTGDYSNIIRVMW